MLYCGDNQANAKFLAHPMPVEGQNHGLSTQWDCWFKLDAVTDVIYFIICNQPTIQIASASIRGYAIEIDGTNSRIDIERLDGGGGLVNLVTYDWAADTDLHIVRFYREVNVGDRLWSLYYGDSLDALALVAGPSATDATYIDFSWWGTDHLTHNRCMWGGESCESFDVA